MTTEERLFPAIKKNSKNLKKTKEDPYSIHWKTFLILIKKSVTDYIKVLKILKLFRKQCLPQLMKLEEPPINQE